MAAATDPPRSAAHGGAAAHPKLVRPVLLYEGGCRFCRWAARGVVRLDRRREIALLSLRSEEAAPILATIPEEERFATWHVVLPDGRRLTGGPAAVLLLERLWWTRWAGRLLRIVAAAPLIGAVDAFISKKKGRLSRRVPDGPAPHRFP